MVGWAGLFDDIALLMTEQLRRAGFVAEYSTPADTGTRESDGTAKVWLNGHGGSIADPFDTLQMYHSRYWAAIGEPTTYNSRYKNPEYDTLIDAMAAMEPSHEDPAYMELYLKAVEIYLRDLIDAPIQQWLHRIPMNTTYWTNWPTAENNYVNGAFWHETVGLIFNKLQPVKA